MRFGVRLLIAAAVTSAAAAPVRAQDLTPGAYTPAPVGVNFGGVSYTFSSGDISFDPSLPVEEGRARLNTTVFTLGRVLNVGGRFANVLIAVPLLEGHLQGRLLGQFQEVDRFGLADPQVRFGFNLWGAPAAELGEFARQRRRGVLGASLTVAMPLGQYDSARFINVGTNRWSFKPELGLSRTWDRWTFEAYAGVWLFTENDEFVGGRTRTQNPLFSSQFHVYYTFQPGLWLAFNGNFYSGGRTSVDGGANFDFQKNSRAGTTVSIPVGRRNSFRVAASAGAYTTIGADFRSVSVAYQHIWGGGF
jgi:hypothetical protein